MNQNFFLWYYSKGVISAGTLLGNIIRSVLHRFHTIGLLTTLLSPWKKDVTFKNWIGFHPIQSLKALFENGISRFLGMLVRLFVIAFGIGMLLVTSLFGSVAFLMFLSAPFLLVVAGIVFFINPLLAAMMALVGAAGLVLALAGYFSREPEEPETNDITILRHRPWFGKLIGRLGLKKEDIDVALLESTEKFVQFLVTRGMNEALYDQAVRVERTAARERFKKGQRLSWEHLHAAVPLGKGWRYAYTPHLDRYALDLSQYDPTEYARLDLVGKDESFKLMLLTLERSTQNSALLVGEPGIGKQTLIHALARMVRENVFEGTVLGESRVLLFDVGRAVSDAMNQGVDVEGALRDLLGEAAYAGNVILAIENIDVYLSGDQGRPNLAPVFGEFLALPRFRLVATASAARYHALEKVGNQVLKFFETVYLRETTEEETLEILLAYAREIEGEKVLFSLPGLLSIIAQSSRYKWEVPFPERALDLARETLSYWQAGAEESLIGPKTVDAFVALKTGMPTGAIESEEKEKLLKLEQNLHERVIGQEEAIRQVAEAMRRARAGFGDVKRPLGSFIFLGPTGVGKTETVKAFAESYFGSEEKMIRLDMSEYQTAEAVPRLIGSEAMGMPGQLVDLVREHPFSILLLDELEKAYPKALDIFLQILDEGFVTDGFGEKVSFRNTIIIATSNAGASLLKEGIEKKVPFEDIKKRVLDFVVEQNIYRLEFLNRFDGVIFFEPLKEAELLQVTRLKLRAFSERLLKEKNITIEFAPGVVERIVEKGYEPEFGARSLNRYIEDTIEDGVVNQIISGAIVSGGKLSVTAENL